MYEVDVEVADPEELKEADAIAVSGGDPFRLLDALRRSGAAQVVRRMVRAGCPYVGMSAGAVVAAPDIAPISLTSPFPLPSAFDSTGLGLTRTLVLPHHDRPGRARRHAEAARRFGRELDLVPLADDEAAVVAGDDGWSILLPDATGIRAARPDDADGVAEAFVAAARAAWGSFLGTGRMAGFSSPAGSWRERIASLRPGGTFLVAVDAEGLCGFAVVLPPAAPGSTGPGELDLLYAHPRVWGAGVAERLHDRALFALFARHCTEAVLFTEARNARALRFYGQHGWRPDGEVRDRSFLDVPIREVRLRRDLADGA